MRVGPIDTDEKVLVVAEIGNNHEGSIQTATELVRRAAESGADAVKFQTFRTEHFVSRRDEDRFRRLKGFELPPDRFRELADLARSHGLLFISTPLDLASADVLENLVDAFKIASSDNTFYPLLDRVARSTKPLILSTGLADEAEIERTFARIRGQRPLASIALLHCVTAYPVPPEQAGLRSISRLAQRFAATVGYSDHTRGIDAAVLSVAQGARIVEKHFTLAHDFSPFRDHQISAEPAELAELVRRIRAAEAMLGDGIKRVQPAEQDAVISARRSIAAGRDLPRGHRIEWGDLTWLRPGGGMPPGQENLLVGRSLKRAVAFGEPFAASDVEPPG